MPDTAKIREMNDAFRKSLAGGKIVMTRSIADHAQLEEILEMVKSYDAFSEDNDPHQEHDFGALEIQGDTIFWKIDLYDKDLQYGSPDPTDPTVTTRVITLMMDYEY